MRAAAGLLAALLLALAPSAQQPHFANQRIVVIANGSSAFSLAVANHYVRLRHIPEQHVLVLDDVPAAGQGARPIAFADCERRLLRPVADWLAATGLTDQIDCIAWSSGFPHAVDIRNAAPAKDKLAGNAAALTGLAGFLRQTASGDLACIALDANPFAHRAVDPAAGRGFGASPDGRGRCYQSVMLTWLGPRGLGFEEALAGLDRAAAADATRPGGTFYLCKNEDIRSRTREPLFAATVAALRERKLAVELLEQGTDGQTGALPVGKTDVLGAVVGVANFDWNKSGSTLLPGAIAEHLTSFGATFQNGGQTKLTAWLRAGAAGSSGTVTEPFALQAKFPTPLLHVYYADGCSLGEAFWQSVTGPYQLLIVGDPACRPFAPLAAPEWPELPAKWQGVVDFAARCAGAARFELWVDGTLAATGEPGVPLHLDTTAFADGPHEVHLVAIGPPPVEVPTAVTRAITIDNHDLQLALATDRRSARYGDRFRFTARLPTKGACELRAGGRLLAAGPAGPGTVRWEIPAARLGLGPVRARLEAVVDGRRVVSEPCEVTTTPAAVPAAGDGPARMLPGLAVDVAASRGRPVPLGTLRADDPLPVPEGATATVRGALRIEQAGLHEWSCGNGELRSLRLGRTVVVPAPRRGESMGGSAVVLELASGVHEFVFEVGGRAGSAPQLVVQGPTGAIALDETRCGQAPFDLAPASTLTATQQAWCDGKRDTAAAPGGEAAVVTLPDAGRIGAVLVYFAEVAEPTRLVEVVTVELGSGRSWSRVKAKDLRPLCGLRGAALLATSGGRRAQQVRVSASDPRILAQLSEVEVHLAK